MGLTKDGFADFHALVEEDLVGFFDVVGTHFRGFEGLEGFN